MALEIIKRSENAESKNFFSRISTDINCGTYQVETPVLYYVVEGKIVLIDRKKETTYNSGEVFFLPSGMTVAFEKEADPGSGKFTSIYIFMCTDLLYVGHPFRPLQKSVAHPGYKKSYAVNVPLTSALLYLTRCYLEQNVVNLDKFETLSFVKIICSDNSSIASNVLLFCSQPCDNYEQLVISNIHHQISEIAICLFGSYQNLYYRCRKAGLPPLREIRHNYVMMSAQIHVLNSTLKIKVIASMFGYANVNNFCNAYTEKFGISPLKHRKQYCCKNEIIQDTNRLKRSNDSMVRTCCRLNPEIEEIV